MECTCLVHHHLVVAAMSTSAHQQQPGTDQDRQRALALSDARLATRQAAAAVVAASTGEPDHERLLELSTAHAALADALHALERLVR